MMETLSIRKQLLRELEINPDITFKESLKRFPDIKRSNYDKIKFDYRKIQEKILSNIAKKGKKKGKKNQKKKSNNYVENEVKSEFHDQDNNSGTKIKKKINMDNVEELILKQLDKSPGVPVLRLVVDFLKLKSQDHSELKEIDLDKFYKIAIDDNDPEIIGDIE